MAPDGNAGIKLYNVSNGRVDDSYFQDDSVGILGDGTRQLILDNNHFSNGEWGMALSGSTNIIISGNQISSESFDGIMIGEVKGGNVTIISNTVTNSTLAGILTFAAFANVSSNTVSSSGFFGIYDLSDSAIISQNNVSANARTGIQISSITALVSSNLIDANQLGVLIWSSGNSTIAGNQVSRNGIGIESALQAGSTGHGLVDHNNIIENGINAMPGVNVVWDAGYPTGGNYWSDYGGVDNCSGPLQNVCPSPDGIGDTPYYSMGVLLDNYPLIRPYPTSVP